MDYWQRKYKTLRGFVDSRILIIGYSAVGKTTLLYNLKLHEIVTTIPTIGFNVETVSHRKCDMTMWDVGGCDRMGPLLRHYFQNTQALIFMVNSACMEEIAHMKELNVGLDAMVMETELADTKVAVFCNMQDKPGARPSSVLRQPDYLNLDSVLAGRPWALFEGSAKDLHCPGIRAMLDWLAAPEPLTHSSTIFSPSSSPSAPSAPSASPSSASPASVSASASASSGGKSSSSPAAGLSMSVWQSWLEVPDEPDDVFLQRLDACTLTDWGHRTHLRIAFVMLSRYGRRQGMERIFASIKKFIAAGTIAHKTKFHETMTYFWTHMVHYCLVQMPAAEENVVATESKEENTEEKKEEGEMTKALAVAVSSLSIPATTTATATITTTTAESDEQIELKNEKEGEDGAGLHTLFHHFLFRNPELSNGGLFLQYYSKQLMLMELHSRQHVVLPDIKPLPSLLPNSLQKLRTKTACVHPNCKQCSTVKTTTTTAAERGGGPTTLIDPLFLSLFEADDLTSWSHELYCRVIFAYLARDGRSGAVDLVFSAFQRREKKSFHVTLTYFWIQLIHHAMLQYANVEAKRNNMGIEAFLAAARGQREGLFEFPMGFDLFWKQSSAAPLHSSLLHSKYYSAAVIAGAEAVGTMVLPDLQPLPSLLLS